LCFKEKLAGQVFFFLGGIIKCGDAIDEAAHHGIIASSGYVFHWDSQRQ